MGWPADDGVSRYYWNEDGTLYDREINDPVYGPDGEPVQWVEPEPDPNESIPYDGPAIWAAKAYRLDLAPETAVTIWLVRDTEAEATDLFQATAGAGMAILSMALWAPINLAQHLRWLAGTEGDLAAVISKTEG